MTDSILETLQNLSLNIISAEEAQSIRNDLAYKLLMHCANNQISLVFDNHYLHVLKMYHVSEYFYYNGDKSYAIQQACDYFRII